MVKIGLYCIGLFYQFCKLAVFRLTIRLSWRFDPSLTWRWKTRMALLRSSESPSFPQGLHFSPTILVRYIVDYMNGKNAQDIWNGFCFEFFCKGSHIAVCSVQILFYWNKNLKINTAHSHIYHVMYRIVNVEIVIHMCDM